MDDVPYESDPLDGIYRGSQEHISGVFTFASPAILLALHTTVSTANWTLAN